MIKLHKIKKWNKWFSYANIKYSKFQAFRWNILLSSNFLFMKREWLYWTKLAFFCQPVMAGSLGISLWYILQTRLTTSCNNLHYFSLMIRYFKFWTYTHTKNQLKMLKNKYSSWRLIFFCVWIFSILFTIEKVQIGKEKKNFLNHPTPLPSYTAM